ncbi:4-hydroxythreonine-4-phosphate dehydrogenase PdxA [Bacteroides propionicifaciens]|uniref:4-hydroxythreonine-4-phosphate dehydrogenase PdxA n=1 Tax=Bacteroides propionicifaciens TaxID=392838 RepID=UPI000366C99D|nr:4-hydroxythreonine-4-phosphate dehydrogenase PdxA [Bacteroides propionicifaciens]
MRNNKVIVGITQGDINGVGYEVILKTFASLEMLEFCIPVVYGSPKVAAYHGKSLEVETNFSIINSIEEASDNTLSILNCIDTDVRVEFSTQDKEAGAAALKSLECAVEDYKNGLIDVLVTAPINKHVIQSENFNFPGHTEYLEDRLGDGHKSLMILLKDDFRVAVATGHLPLREVPLALTKELIERKINIFNQSLINDFGIAKPRIAVLGLNPHAGDDGLLGNEEIEIIKPAIQQMNEDGLFCYGPFSADGFFGSNDFTKFDGILAMYHDQGLIPFKVLAMEDGVNFTAGLPVVRTSPAHGTAYSIAGKGIASESSFRQAIYTAIDVFRYRKEQERLSANPLGRLYFNKKDDSDKLVLDKEDDHDDF